MGEVDWAYQRLAAESVARHLKRMVWVINEITINPPSELVDIKVKLRAPSCVMLCLIHEQSE